MKIYLLFFCNLLAACTTVLDKDNASSKIQVNPNADKVPYDVQVKKQSSGILIKEVAIDTLSLFHESTGIKLSFDAQILQPCFDSLKKTGYTSCYIQLSCTTDKGIVFSSMEELNKTKRMHVNKERIFSSPDLRNIEFQFPYRELEMKAGRHQVNLHIDVFPLSFKKDTSSPFFNFIDKIGKEPLTTYSIPLKVSAPPLHKAVLEISGFKINTSAVNPQHYDFSLGGSGLPDLYWELYCGEDFIYYSPEEKNVVEYKKKYSTKPFFCSDQDVIKITFADYDNGPFNTEDDIVDIWTGKLSEFKLGKRDTLSFGKIEYAIIQARIVD